MIDARRSEPSASGPSGRTMTSVITSPMTRIRRAAGRDARPCRLEVGVMVATRAWTDVDGKIDFGAGSYQKGPFGRTGADWSRADLSLNWRRSRGRIVIGCRSSNHDLRRFISIALGGALAAAPIALALMFPAPKADATPAFARQTGRNCNFCHRGVPRRNDTGLAFKNSGFHFPKSSKPTEEDHKDKPRP